MKREDCWMTFSEALELYLDNREQLDHFGEGRNKELCKEQMETAKKHMDALTNC